MKRTNGERRRDVVEACRARFVGRTYEPGSRDCKHLGRHAMHGMGHKVALAKGVRYSTEAGGLRVMKRLGFANLMEAMDATGRPRIAPAAALPADILALKSEDGAAGFCCALAVYVGNGKAITFVNGEGVVASLTEAPLTGWRL